jgi:hypothetical protein
VKRRAHITLKTKLAAALIELTRVRLQNAGWLDDANRFYEDSKRMTAEQIISLFHFDHHPVPHAGGGPDEPWNLTPLLLRQHRTKTAKHDVPALAKVRRIEGKWSDFHRAVAEGHKPPTRKSRWPKRPMNARQKQSPRSSKRAKVYQSPRIPKRAIER